jgi:excisionase family DNA binding protein
MSSMIGRVSIPAFASLRLSHAVCLGIMVEEMTRRLLSVKEACHYLHLSRTALYHMMERKELIPVNIGGRTLFDRKDLDDLIERSKAVPQEILVKKRGRKPKASK